MQYRISYSSSRQTPLLYSLVKGLDIRLLFPPPTLSTIENPKVPTEKTVSTLGFSIVLSVFPLPRAWHSVHIFRSFSRPVPSSVSPSAPRAASLSPRFPLDLYFLRHIPHKNPVSGLARPRVFSIFASAALSSGVKFFMRCNSLRGRAFRPLPRSSLQIFPKKVAVKFGGEGKSVYFCTRKSGTALRCRPPESSKEAIFERFT